MDYIYKKIIGRKERDIQISTIPNWDTVTCILKVWCIISKLQLIIVYVPNIKQISTIIAKIFSTRHFTSSSNLFIEQININQRSCPSKYAISWTLKPANVPSSFLLSKTITIPSLGRRHFYYPVLVARVRSLLTFPGRLPSLMDSICKPRFTDRRIKKGTEKTGVKLIAWKSRNNHDNYHLKLLTFSLIHTIKGWIKEGM